MENIIKKRHTLISNQLLDVTIKVLNHNSISKITMEIGNKLNINYNSDEIPWCGLFMAIVAKRASKEIPENPLWALNWSKFGIHQSKAMLGDVLTFKRQGGGHVGLYVYENKDNYGVLGGNQKDKVGIVEIKKIRLQDIRRPKYNMQPSNVRQIILNVSSGLASENEK